MQDFANNAASFSACPGTKSNGGDLGEVRQQEFHGDMLGIPLQFEGNINGIVMEYWFNVVIKHGNWKFPKHAGFRQIIELNVVSPVPLFGYPPVSKHHVTYVTVTEKKSDFR